MAALCLSWAVAIHAQAPQPGAPSSFEKLGRDLFRIGQIRVDTAKREISVPGTVNEVTVLEFVANTRDGLKAYESAITLNTNAVSFNAALLLIGLDRSRSQGPKSHFDPDPPKGDPVALHVEWARGSGRTRVEVEALLFDKEKGLPVPASGWVYTGSTFTEDGQYMAEIDGTLIGFVHSPSPIIEQVAGAGVRRFGQIVLNPNLGLEPNTSVTLTVKALGSADRVR